MKNKKSTRKLSLESTGTLAKFFGKISNEERRNIFTEIFNKHGVEIKINAVGMIIIKTNNDKSEYIYQNFAKLNKAKDTITPQLIMQAITDKELEVQEEPVSEEEMTIAIELKHLKAGLTTIVRPKTKNQELFLREMLNKKVIFGLGSAGTGKTFLAVAAAIKLYDLRRISKIIISRPVVEAGASIGFLPGTAEEKLGPYVAPIMSILTELIGSERRDKLLRDRVIEIENIGYLRGMTIGARQGVVAIMDEAQNLDFVQHKLLLTRLGSHPESRIIFCGDQKQSDLRFKKDTLSTVSQLIKRSKFVGTVVFDKADVVRSEAVKDILGLIEDFEDAENIKRYGANFVTRAWKKLFRKGRR